MNNKDQMNIYFFLRLIGLILIGIIAGQNALAFKTNNFDIYTMKKQNEINKKIRFAFLPDIHYAHVGKLADGGTSWGLKEEGLVALVDYLKKQSLDFAVLGGDFCNIDCWFSDVKMIDDAHNSFERVKKEFKRLNIPIYYLRGNHETYCARIGKKNDKNNKFYDDKLYRYHCGYGPDKTTYYDFNYAGWKFIALDSGPMISSIKSKQMSWLREVLKKTADITPIIVFVHGPLYPFFGNKPESTKLVTNYKEVIDAFNNYSLKIVLQGHLHKNDIEEITQTNSLGNKKKIYFVLSGAPYIAINNPFNPNGGFDIVDIVRKEFVISRVEALSAMPKIILTSKNPESVSKRVNKTNN